MATRKQQKNSIPPSTQDDDGDDDNDDDNDNVDANTDADKEVWLFAELTQNCLYLRYKK